MKTSAGDKALDLAYHRALAVTLQVDGARSVGDSDAVLNIQFETRGKAYRDYD